jgi:hypothetical protein
MSFPFVQPYFGLGNSLQTAQAGGAGGPSAGGWVELGRHTLGSGADNMDVTSLPDKRYYMLLSDIFPSGSTTVTGTRLNGDTGSNYAERRQLDGASDNPSGSNTHMILHGVGVSQEQFFEVGYFANLAAKEKLYIGHSNTNSSGAGTAPSRQEWTEKWSNTSDAINQISKIQTIGGADFASGSELVILGWDPTDTHTTNFWEEIGTATGTGVEDVTASASKKYNWIQGWVNPTSGSTSMNLQLGNGSLDTGGNYAWRYSLNGAGDITTTGDSSCILYGTGADTSIHMFYNIFFINNSAKEKLIMIHNVYYDTAGAGSAPIRFEIAGKWTNTSAQANHAGIVFSAGNAASNSELRWWGSD